MKAKPIVILNGSPRKNGNSAILAEQVALGARQAGAEVHTFFLHDMDIQPCSACEACQETNPGECIIEDDMQSLYPELRQAGAIVIATPVYWFTMSAQAKLCIDRWYALESPQGSALKGKSFGVLLAYGDSDPYTSGGINAIRTFQDMIAYLGSSLSGVVYGSALKAGEISEQAELLEKAYRLGEKLASETN